MLAAIGIGLDAYTPIVWGLDETHDRAMSDAAVRYLTAKGEGRWDRHGSAVTDVGSTTLLNIECGEIRCEALDIRVRFNARGMICHATAPVDMPGDLERSAIRWIADYGAVPYRLFAALDEETRGRLAVLSQTKARRMLAATPALTTTLLDELAVDHLRTRKR